MKKLSRFFAVLWFQASASVWPVLILAVLSYLGCAGSAEYYYDLGLAICPFVLTTWIVMAAAIAIYVPEFFLPGFATKNARTSAAALFGLEFLATRPVSRSCIFRARGVIFWLVLLISIFWWMAWSAIHPSLILLLPAYSGDAGKAGLYLTHIPGSVVEQIASDGDVTIRMPMGNLQLHILLGATTIIVSSVWICLLPLLARLPFRRGIFWTGAIGGNLMLPVMILRQREAEPYILLGFQTMPYLLAGAVILALGAQWFAEKQLAKLELM